MRLLWISGLIFDDLPEKHSGVWQKALALKIISNSNVEIGSIAVLSSVKEITKYDFDNITQWAFPPFKLKKGIPPRHIEKSYIEILSSFKPDIVLIWGTECKFGLMPYYVKSHIPVALYMQGVLHSIGESMLNGFSIKEVLQTLGLREVLYHSSIISIKRSLEKRGLIEDKIIKCCNYIITQSEWTKSQIKHINKEARFFYTHIALRNEFLTSSKWSKFSHQSHVIYATAIYGYPIKGIIVLLKALVIVRHYYPDVRLRIAGNKGREDVLGDGYLRFIISFIKNNNLKENVEWLGPLDEYQIISELQNASLFVNPSFIESYSLATAEAMSVGTPSVISYAGAMPELAFPDGALFFTPGDYKQCAYQICKLLSDAELSNRISIKSLEMSGKRECEFDIVEEQMNIYTAIINDYKNK